MPYQNKRKQTKQKITNAFLSLYKERDITKINVRDICEAASINRSTFYDYYEDIYCLQEEIEGNLMDLMSERLAPVLMDPEHPFDANRLVKTMIRTFHEHDDIPLLIIRRSNGIFISRLINYVTSFMEDMFGEMSQSSKEQFTFCMHYHFAGVISALNAIDQGVLPWTIDQTAESIGRVADQGVIHLVQESVMLER